MKNILTILTTFLFASIACANDIQVANSFLSNQNTGAHNVAINFDVNWKNSWRTSTNERNYDGAWIFVKFKKLNTNNWQHCTISTTGSTASTGSAIKVPADGKGCWVYRSANGIGDVNFTGEKLTWNYGADGVLDTDSCEIRVFGLEMVYVPQGQFYLGSNGTEDYHFQDSTSNSPYLVTSDDALNFGTTNGKVNAAGVNTNYTLPAAFPKGFDAFWCMKYECSQQQYVDFLNNIDQARALANGSGVFQNAHPALMAPVPSRAVAGISRDYMLAWSDWAGLRPMSELEFEKAARGGNIMPIPNEYAWGNTTLVGANVINDAGLESEYYNADANTNSSGIGRLTRCGGFATSTTSANRQASGASYYGIMDLTGNGWERCVCANNTTSFKAFDKTIHGDGNLTAAGTTDIATWNNIALTGYMLRGGAINIPTLSYYTISGRTYSQFGFGDGNATTSFRLVRTGE